MITSIHTLIYSDDANATRAFLRDVLGWKYVAEDFDNDWLIFKSGPSEMGVHPTHSEWEGQTYDYPRHHSIALMCDDIDTTIGELRAKGAQFRGPIEQREYGRVIMMIVPGADDIQLYQPTHKLAQSLEHRQSRHRLIGLTYEMSLATKPSNRSIRPTALFRSDFSVFATTPCRGLSLSR
jgi:catechol 2,3-dioxygenase-like lactoylglutathione lyase family enzyme